MAHILSTHKIKPNWQGQSAEKVGYANLAYIFTAYSINAYIVTAYSINAYIVTAYSIKAYIVTAYSVVTYIVMVELWPVSLRHARPTDHKSECAGKCAVAI